MDGLQVLWRIKAECEWMNEQTNRKMNEWVGLSWVSEILIASKDWGSPSVRMWTTTLHFKRHAFMHIQIYWHTLLWGVLKLVPSVVPPQERKMRRSGPLQVQIASASLPHTNYVSLSGFHPPPHPFSFVCTARISLFKVASQGCETSTRSCLNDF